MYIRMWYKNGFSIDVQFGGSVGSMVVATDVVGGTVVGTGFAFGGENTHASI